jgi:hypothetical protein
MIKKLADTQLKSIEGVAGPSSIWRDPRTGKLSSLEGLKNIAAWWLIFAQTSIGSVTAAAKISR